MTSLNYLTLLYIPNINTYYSHNYHLSSIQRIIPWNKKEQCHRCGELRTAPGSMGPLGDFVRLLRPFQSSSVTTSSKFKLELSGVDSYEYSKTVIHNMTSSSCQIIDS